jgi:hypothetical protein
MELVLEIGPSLGAGHEAMGPQPEEAILRVEGHASKPPVATTYSDRVAERSRIDAEPGLLEELASCPPAPAPRHR